MAKRKRARKPAEFRALMESYVDDVLTGRKIAGETQVQACQRYREDLQRTDIEFRENVGAQLCFIIESTMVHRQGEDLEGKPLKGKPFILEPWEIFVIMNLASWYNAGTNSTRFKEAFIAVPRKNGKTSLVAALAWGFSIQRSASGSSVYIVAASLKQRLQSFNFIKNSIEYYSLDKDGFKILNNSFNHSIEGKLDNGSIRIEALASNPSVHDSFNANVAIIDEVQALKTSAQYNRFKEATAAYTNKLTIGITTAGDEINSFGYDRFEYGKKILNGTSKNDSLFVFITMADVDAKGYVDYTDPIQHEKRNPSYGVTIKAEDILNDSYAAQDNPKDRKDFLSRRLNVYTSRMTAYFDLNEVRYSDRQYSWTLDELAKLPVKWYGGADLSRMHDLTAARLVGEYNETLIYITHAFFPITEAHRKADEDNIPLFGWRDDGWLTMTNSPTVNYSDVVDWFRGMRRQGFKIVEVGYDKAYAVEFIEEMESVKFTMTEQPQYHRTLSPAFRRFEKGVKDGKVFYLHSEAFEYCVENVRGIEKTAYIQYEKNSEKDRIDLFDASMFATCRLLEGMRGKRKKEKLKTWFKSSNNNE